MLSRVAVAAVALSACVPPTSGSSAGSLPTANVRQAVGNVPPSYNQSGTAQGGHFGHALAVLRAPPDLGGFFAVGAPAENGDEGAVYIFTRAPRGGMFVAPSWSPLVRSGVSAFGGALAAADFNGDGLDDLIVGAPGTGATVGSASLYLGQADGGLRPSPADFTNPLSGPDIMSGGFGSVITTGDLNSDGKADVAIAAPGAGVVAIFYGGSAPSLAAQIFSVPSASALSVVDVDGMGGLDLLVGVPSQNTVLVFLSNAQDGGLGLSTNVTGTSGEFGASFASWSSAAGQLQMAVGAPSAVDTVLPVGAVYVLSPKAFINGQLFPGLKTSNPDLLTQSRFGTVLATVGHFSGDPGVDLLVGAPGDGLLAGAVYLYSSRTLPTSLDLLWSDNAGLGLGAQLGGAVAGGQDLDGDHLADLLVGAEGADNGNGRVYVYYGVISMPFTDAGVACTASSCPICQTCLNLSCAPIAGPCDDGLFCTSGDFCSGGTCVGGTASCPFPNSCSEAEGRCLTYGQAVIVDDANRSATVGAPYVYNSAGTVTVNGDPPIVLSSCDSTPVGFTVDKATGLVTWTPTVTGNIPICIHAENDAGFDELRYTVKVSPSGTPLTAQFTLDPLIGPAPLHVVLDGTGSTSAISWNWDFGDMSSPRSGELVDHVYLLPGSYPVTLTVTDGVTVDTLRQSVSVTDATGAQPPTATIQYDETNHNFLCDSQPGSSPIAAVHWDFEDRTITANPAHRDFLAGLHRVRVRAVDANGLTGNDSIFVRGIDANPLPVPGCLLSIDPPAGFDPLSTAWSARTEDSSAFATLSFPDAGVMPIVGAIGEHYATPGVYPGVLSVTNLGGRPCTDFAYAIVVGASGQAPRITQPDLGLNGACTGTFTYQPEVTGTRPLRFTLAAPPGVELDSQTGELTWQAPIEAKVTLTAANDAGVSSVTFELDDSCDTLPDAGRPQLDFTTTPCGCATGDASGLLLGVLLLLRRLSRA